MLELFHVTSYKQTGDELDPAKKPYMDYYNPFLSSLKKGQHEFFEYYHGDYIQNDIFKDTGRRPSKWACEAIFEQIRDTTLPSRLSSVYLFANLDDAKRFQQCFRPDGKIYRVKIPDNHLYEFDMNIFTKAEEHLYKEGLSEKTYYEVTELAKIYWSGFCFDYPNKEIIYSAKITLDNL